MNNSQFIAEIYSIAWSINPDLDKASSFQDIVATISNNKEKAIRWDIMQAAFDLPGPELPNIPHKHRRQGQL